MLSAEIWKSELGLGWDDNLCIACIEVRLGRQLRLDAGDFCGMPSLEGYAVSDTLLDRYGFSKEMREKARKKARK
jgi:hypothetical protein